MILVTGGCSFSECKSPWVDTWPRHLERAIAPEQAFHEGLGGQGNGMIARQIIWRVSQLLEHRDRLLVGIMWTAPDRHEVLLHHTDLPKNVDYGAPVPGEPNKLYNPYNWIADTPAKWLLLHYSSTNGIAKELYAKMHNPWHSQIITIEHILRVQWFLQHHNIKYFMSTYTGNVVSSDLCNHPDVKYLYDQIDFDWFLPVTGEYEWCRDHSGLDFPVAGDRHPGTPQHKLFVDQVVHPFLKQRNFI